MTLTIRQLHDLLLKEIKVYNFEIECMDGSRPENYHFVKGRRAEAYGIIYRIRAELGINEREKDKGVAP